MFEVETALERAKLAILERKVFSPPPNHCGGQITNFFVGNFFGTLQAKMSSLFNASTPFKLQ